MDKICLVDDEQDLVSMCADYLRGQYEIRAFSSAQEAYKAFENEYLPDVLVSDYKMPEMSGLDLAHMVRINKLGIPIIMISAYAEKNNLLQAFDESVLAFLEKPFDPKKLKSLIQDVTARSQSYKRLSLLVQKYEVLVHTSLDLNRKYLSRFSETENFSFGSGHNLSLSKEGARAYLNRIKSENESEALIESLLKEIESIKASVTS